MHIGFLTPEYPHQITGRSGGIGTSIYNLAQELKRTGNKVTIFVSGQACDGIFSDDGVSVVRIKNKKIKGLSWFLTRKKIQRVINSYVENEGLSIVEAPDWGGLSAFVRSRCPLVIRCNGSDTYFCYLEGREVKHGIRFLERKALRSAKGIISVSDFTASITSQLFKIDKEKIKVIPNGIRTELFPLAKDYKKNTLLYFGTLIRKKGLLELPLIFNDLVQRHPDATLTLIGGDSTDVKTKKSTWSLMQNLFSDRARKNVLYKGVSAYSDLVREINQAHVCLFPSFIEAFPVSWLEAMACGKAIVASNIGWAKECIDDQKEGFLVNPKNHAEFASRICELLEDAEKTSLFGISASEKVSRYFSSKVVAGKTLQFYKEHLDK